MADDNKKKRARVSRNTSVAGLGLDITRGYMDGVRLSSDDIVQDKNAGDVGIYEEIKQDAQVKSCFGQLANSVLAAEWIVESGGDGPSDDAAADFIREEIDRLSFHDITDKALWSIFFGYGVWQTTYVYRDNFIRFKDFITENRRWYRFDDHGGLRMLTEGHLSEGVPVKAPQFWSLSVGADNDYEPYGRGLGWWLYWPCWFKKNGIKFWAVAIEKFAVGTPVGKHDPSADDGDVAELKRIVSNFKYDNSATIPDDMSIEIVESARSGFSYKEFIDLMDKYIAKIILTQTMTTDDGSSRSQATVHESRNREGVRKAAKTINAALQDGPIKFLIEQNFPEGTAVPILRRDIPDPVDEVALSQRDKNLFDVGYKPTLETVNETYGGEWVEVATATGWAVEDPAEFAEAIDASDSITPLVQQMSNTGAIEPMVAAIRSLADRAESLEELKHLLETALPSLPTEQLQELLRESFVLSDLTGREDVAA